MNSDEVRKNIYNLTFSSQIRQLDPSHYGLQLRKLVDENIEYCIPAPYEYIQEQASVHHPQEQNSAAMASV